MKILKPSQVSKLLNVTVFSCKLQDKIAGKLKKIIEDIKND